MTKKGKNICVGEELRIAVTLTLKKFRMNEDQKELEFPSSLTNVERAFIHMYCQSLGLKSKSRGNGANRYLTVYKKEGSTIVQADAVFQMGRVSKQHVVTLLERYPVSARERQELLPPTERDRLMGHENRDVNRTTGRLNNGIPQVPQSRLDSELSSVRESLPIWPLRENIVKTIFHNQVVLLVGDTGCGKTTQVPQFILDHCHVSGQPCRIICTQPRRLAALSVAERVAAERGEKIGQTVGYQIRLESRVSPKTLLTFCTNGVLLRTLMGGDAAMATVTHVIIDEIHERDRFSDFLMIIARDLLLKFRNLKLVLMSATLDTQLFVKYFGGCPVVDVPGQIHDVKAYFLEDVLKSTGYMSKAMQKYKKELSKFKSQKEKLNLWCTKGLPTAVSDSACSLPVSTSQQGRPVTGCIQQMGYYIGEQLFQEKTELTLELKAEMDKALEEAWLRGSEEAFTHLIHLILSENISVDYQHSETSASPLMIASGRGNTSVVEELLNFGATITLRASNDWTAIDWAQKFEQKEVYDILMAYLSTMQYSSKQPEDDHAKAGFGLDTSGEDKELLDIYQHTFDDELVDYELILCLLHKIHSSQEEGAILVFLPGYDDIVTMREKILSDDKRISDASRYVLYTLHSSMQSYDQKCVFKPAPPGVRKIILATNIAETSITISDVVFIIDCGKVKEKSYDALVGVTMLKSVWVSQSSAIQRRGRAGRCRPGFCYHMFSRTRFPHLQRFQLPEILRMPIHELCLQAKLLAPPNVPIADFLARAPDPPAFIVTRKAVTLLKTIDALDPWEQLTELGLHLLDLPIEPRLGKMVLYSVVLKCLDPILTVVCALAYKDPFLLPNQPSQKRASHVAKQKLAADTFSDHMVLLRAFQAWQKARNDGYEKAFGEKTFISAATMEMIVGIRTQLLGQLRASGFVRARGGGDIRDLNSNSENWAVVKAALCAGMYPNLIRVDRERQQLITQQESKVRFHPSSVMNRLPKSSRETIGNAHKNTVSSLPSDWLVYEEMTRTGHLAYARCVTLVSPITVALFAGPARLPLDAVHEPEQGRFDGYMEESDSEEEEKTEGPKSIFKLDEWVCFKIEPELSRLSLNLRQKWHALFLRRMQSPAKPWSQVDEAVVRAIVGVLTAEEQALGLQQPAGIGQRPKPMANDFCPPVPSSNQQTPIGQAPGAYPIQGISNTPLRTSARHGSLESDPSDDSWSNTVDASRYSASFPGSKPSFVPLKKGIVKKRYSRGSDEKSDTSSVRSAGSGSGSTPISPCHSPAPPNTSTTSSLKEKSELSVFGLPSSTRYFIIKASSLRAIDVSVANGIWAFTPSTERKLLWALKDGKEVCLVFSAQGSGHFQGYARLTSEIQEQRSPEFCAPNLGNCYRIEWMKRANLPFQVTRQLQNPWNENRKVQISRDGQELEPSVGEALCKLWDKMGPSMTKSWRPAENQPPIGQFSSYGGRDTTLLMSGGGVKILPNSPWLTGNQPSGVVTTTAWSTGGQ
ncbi:probable ATP-dependent RNA helicase YTHDC2 isoform X2 [Limulus polyphemus]|nr:probable ATP-dependent RNA helicase YTHDC2 isoform X2 [Limulus polyphemus]